MRFKRRLRRILSSFMMMTALSSMSATALKKTPKRELSANLSKEVYSKAEVAAILDVCEKNMEAAVEEAYNAGFKAASLKHAPDAEYYRILSSELEKESRAMHRRTALTGVFSFLSGFAAGLTVWALSPRGR